MGFGTGFNALLTYKYASENKITINYDSIDNFPLENFDSQSYIEPLRELNSYSTIFNMMHHAKWGIECSIVDYFKLTKYNQSIINFSAIKKYDVIYFDAFAPTAQPELWSLDIMSKMYDMLNNGGILTTYCAQGQLKRNLKQAGFIVESIPGPLYKREMTRAIKL
jgi:tRNA U34 5-methylaminomethyl-2-thiouridine-forming methyltransferase MnmC